jgi:uncharacterized cupredoxin-like copper-binding protein
MPFSFTCVTASDAACGRRVPGDTIRHMILRTACALLLAISWDAAAQRTVSVTMSDTMRYDPAQITVMRGDTLLFVDTNIGKHVLEIVIGTRKELEDHAEHMRKHPGMDHGHHEGDGMLRLEPGKTGEMKYRFDEAGTFHYGCLEPGHLEAGMIGKVTVQ